jgi:urease accessory protein
MDTLLLLLLDSRSPSGAHNHSGGMEPAVTQGFVRDVDDVEAFCRARLRTGGRVAASAAAAACLLVDASGVAWRDLDDEVSARLPAEALRLASRRLGSGLRRLLRVTVPNFGPDWSLIERPAPHHPLVLGAGVGAAGGTPELAARAAALATCTAPASAAVRLLGLDPYAVHGVLARLGPEIDAVATSCADGHLAVDSAPALDLWADVHLTAEVRLFAS